MQPTQSAPSPQGKLQGQAICCSEREASFTYLRNVVTASFDLISNLRETIALLLQKLYAADARNTELEAKQADLEAQNKSLVEQLRINKEACNALAQHCRLAKEKNTSTSRP